MEVKERYIHTRNYGCRIRQYTIDGDFRMLSMENAKIKVVFALDKGADILELVYKPEDLDYMWHSFNQLKNSKHQMTKAAPAGNFSDTYVGGWQDLFPTYGAPATMNYGAEIGIHGEACLYPWDCEILEDTPECVKIKLSLRTIRTPFLLEKVVCIREDSAKLEIHEKITNLGSREEEFMWGQHPAYGWPFIGENTRLYLNGTPRVTVPAGVIAERCPFEKETTGTWPILEDKEGNKIDMSRAYSHEDRIYMEYGISDLGEGKYELINEEKGLGIRMRWDVGLFPYLWVWGMYCGHESYPWYGRAYTMAVEPWSSMPGDFMAAKKTGSTLHLEAGKSMETDFSAELFAAEEVETAAE